MTPNDRARVDSLSRAGFDLAKRMQVGREFLKQYKIDGNGHVCSLAYHIRRAHKRAAKAIRNNANDIINTCIRESILSRVNFD